MPVKFYSLCYYFSDKTRTIERRQQDWDIFHLIKAVKGEQVNGTFTLNVSGQARRFDRSNASDAARIAINTLGKRVSDLTQGNIVLVPVPNSYVTRSVPDFGTLRIARRVAEVVGERAEVKHMLCWKQAMEKSRKGGTRDKFQLFRNLSLIGSVDNRPHILIDDVCTTGAHFMSAAARLRNAGANVAFAACIGRTTNVQHERMITDIEENLFGASLLRG
nr:phosphoribosyltransferase [uncultured Azospirillum sp.]